jgi:cysteine-rich repeat protein
VYCFHLSPPSYYTIVVKMQDYDNRYCNPPVTACSSAHILSDVMVDFFVQVIQNDGTKAPAFVAPTPADGSTISVNAGSRVTLPIKCTDADGDAFDLQASWSVANMRFLASSGTGALTTSLVWDVPAAPQQINQACFFARDARGVESPLHCITLKIGQITVTSLANNDVPGNAFVYSGQTVKVVGENMLGSVYKCRFRKGSGSVVDVAAVSIGLREMRCAAPNVNTDPGTYVVEVTKDGVGYTTDARTIEIRASCPPSLTNICSGHGACNNGVCACTAPYSGSGCQSTCGDGKLTEGETCDDGNLANGDGCSSTCRIETGCSCSGVPSTCQCCGNGNREGSETCDDGNLGNGDGCSASCGVEPGFSCSTASPNVCEKCGNGIREGSELGATKCDDGNRRAGDGCSASCDLETGWSCAGSPSVCAKCGNGVREGGETCDDGNTAASDGCSATCTLETGWTCTAQTQGPEVCEKCGNGIREGAEECDDGGTTGGDGCEANCRLTPGWSCDTAAVPNTCVNTPELCGDGKLDGTETCDDGNKVNGDGCSFGQCQPETGYTCSAATPSVCYKCGNGVVETAGGAAETCDDGNAAAGDGCSATCVIETGFTCTSDVPSVCQKCGDSAIQGIETCDDGNADAGDGCSAECQIEDGYFCDVLATPNVCQNCGNGKIEGTEACDDGNQFSLDGCSHCKVDKDWTCTTASDGKSECTPDVRPPLTPGSIFDGGDFTSVGDSISAYWRGFADPRAYWYAIGSSFNATDVVGWTGTETQAQMKHTLALEQGKTYYISVRAKNSYNEYSYGFGDGVTYDGTPPTAGAIVDGAVSDAAYTKITTAASFMFYPFTDLECGVDAQAVAKVGLGTQPGTDDAMAFKDLAPGATSGDEIFAGASELRDGTTYYWTVQVPNTIGTVGTGSSNGFTVDLQPPTSVGVIVDDRVFQGTANEVRASWATQFNDTGSGLDRIEWALGLMEDGAAADGVLNWANIGSAQEVYVSNETPMLADKKRYRVTLRAYDRVGLTAEVVSDGFTVDLSAPTAGVLVAGSSADAGVTELSSTDSFPLAWSGFEDPESGIDHYEVALGTTFNSSDVANFTRVGSATAFTLTDLDLSAFAESKAPLYGRVRAYNGAGSFNESRTAGITIDASGAGAGKSAVKDGDDGFLSGTAGKSLLGAGIATAAVLGAGVAGFLGLKSMKKRRLAARTEAARVAKREQMRRHSSLAADSNEFSVDMGDDMADAGDNGPVEEVESAGYA